MNIITGFLVGVIVILCVVIGLMTFESLASKSRIEALESQIRKEQYNKESVYKELEGMRQASLDSWIRNNG